VVTQRNIYTRRLPELHAVLRRLRTFVDAHAHHAVLISEAYVEDAGELARFYGNDDEIQLPFNFALAQVPGLDAAAFRRAVAEVELACAGRWPSLVLSNHDIDRACDRYADSADIDAVGKLLAVMLLTLRGIPFLYYGEEIAMRTYPPARVEEVRDPVGRRFWPTYKGRDGVRRPMPWEAGMDGAGFTRGRPWLPLSADAGQRNVASQQGQPGSVLELYRRVIAARQQHAALRDGEYEALESPRDVFAFLRRNGRETVLVLLNMSAEACEMPVAGIGRSAEGAVWHVVAGTHRRDADAVGPGPCVLAPFEGVVLADAIAR
jgi:alpha-glucosidase